jgi:hypothetical protein
MRQRRSFPSICFRFIATCLGRRVLAMRNARRSPGTGRSQVAVRQQLFSLNIRRWNIRSVAALWLWVAAHSVP